MALTRTEDHTLQELRPGAVVTRLACAGYPQAPSRARVAVRGLENIPGHAPLCEKTHALSRRSALRQLSPESVSQEYRREI